MIEEVNFGYYTSQQFEENISGNDSYYKNNFSAFHCNVRSLSANYNDLYKLLTDLAFPISIIGLSGTKILHDVRQISNTDILGYDFISQPTLSNAGGVGFSVKHGLQYHIRDDLSALTEEYESLWIEINCRSSKNVLCGVIYRHPKGKTEQFIEHLSSVLDRVSTEKKLCVFMGDFNIDLLNFDTCQLTQVYVNMLSSYFILPQIIQPTRITRHIATIIDNIFISCTDQSKISGNIVHDITDHLPNFLILNKLLAFTSKQEIYKRDYSRLNESDLLQDVQSINWHDIFQPEDNLNHLFSSFHSHISNIIDKHAPIRKLTKNEMKYRSKPWITPGLKNQ